MRTTVGSEPSHAPFLWVLRPYFRQVWGLLLLGSLGGIAMNTAVVLPALLLGRAINAVLAVEHHRAGVAQVGWAALLLVAGTAATELPRIAKRYWLGVARTRFRASVRQDALRGVLAWPTEKFVRIPVGDVMARVIGDVEVLGTGVGEVMVETWDTLLFSASLILAMLAIDPGLAVLSLAPVPVALLLAKRAERLVAHRTTRARETESELTAALREQIGGVRLLRLLGGIEAAAARVGRLARAQARAELAAISLDEALAAAYTVVLSSGVLFIIWLGGERVAGQGMSVGALVAFLALFVRFVTRAPRIPQMANRVQAAGAAHRRLAPLLAPPLATAGEPRWTSFRPAHVPDLGAGPGDDEPPGAPGPVGLRFVGAGLTYPGAAAPALVGVDFEVPAGALVAVTGPVGSGKSTLARVAAGLLPPDLGRVEVGGRSLADLGPALRVATIGYLAQEPQVFSGTVAENLNLWSHLAGTAEMDRATARAVTLAALDRDLEEMPAGLATQIGELGVRVSGGQRQRIALARAIGAAGRVPGLLVLDDPFSAVDVGTEAAIVAGLRRAFGPQAPPSERATILLFSHRLAAFSLADLVLVLDRGRVREQGTHAELLAAAGLYARIVRAQATMESLGAGGASS
ncbi:MAG: ABC transporter ATP-binding protein [Candidatus Dormibacteria bacterium]